ncbi:MAG: hypothetical protein AAF798_04145 [Bacteroidota bacterium]
MLYFAFATLLVTIIALVWVLRIFSSYNPGKKRVQEDLKKMKLDLDQQNVELVPIDEGELELFSTNQIKQILKKGITTTATGVFTTIFDEPVLAYSYKKYVSKGHNAILLVRTANHEFAYRIQKGEIRIVIDSQLVGALKADGVLYGAKSQKVLAKVNRESDRQLPVLVNNREVGNLALVPTGSSKLKDRAFQFVRDDLSRDERNIFLSLAALEMVMQKVEQ